MGYRDEKFQTLDSVNIKAYRRIREKLCRGFSDRAQNMVERERPGQYPEDEGERLEWWQDQLLEHLRLTKSFIRIHFAQEHYVHVTGAVRVNHSPPDGLEDGLRLEWRDEKGRLNQDTKVLFLVIDTVHASSDARIAEDLTGGKWRAGDLDSLEAWLPVNYLKCFQNVMSGISGRTTPESRVSTALSTDTKPSTGFLPVDPRITGDVQSKAPTTLTEADDGPWTGAQFASTVSSLMY
jgi:hypothetical protein